jgi:type VI secretion system protein
MREDRLLERIRRLDEQQDRRQVADPALLSDSVMHHLLQILNTRQGSCQSAPDLGVPDFTHLSASTDAPDMQAMERTIEKVIERFEPRMKDVRMRFKQRMDNSLTLLFTIEGRLALEDLDIPVIFESLVDADGRVNINR